MSQTQPQVAPVERMQESPSIGEHPTILLIYKHDIHLYKDA
jgi:hypothetical protein